MLKAYLIINHLIILFLLLITQDVKTDEVKPCTVEFLKFIPTITCYSPKSAIQHTSSKKSKFAFKKL